MDLPCNGTRSRWCGSVPAPPTEEDLEQERKRKLPRKQMMPTPPVLSPKEQVLFAIVNEVYSNSLKPGQSSMASLPRVQSS